MRDDRLKTFDDLVSWATWRVIEGITKGESLYSIMFGIVDYARRWKPEDSND